MRYDGTDRRARIKITGFTVNAPAAEPNLADEILVSPDSQQVVALVNNYVYLVNLPMTGQEPITHQHRRSVRLRISRQAAHQDRWRFRRVGTGR